MKSKIKSMSKKRYEYKGAFHIHSSYSDGAGTVQQIAEAARSVDLDFAIITDHNKLTTIQKELEGWYEDTLVIAGVEISLSAGHYLALDVPPNLTWEKRDVQGTIDRVNESGGFGLLSHPVSRWPWKDWRVTGYKGMEVANLSSLFHHETRQRPAGFLLDFVRSYLGDPHRAMKRVIAARSENALGRWSNLLQDGHLVGIGGTDAHAVLKIGPGRLYIPSYSEIFRSLQLYIFTETSLKYNLAHDRAVVFNAIREGRCYTAYSLWGDASGFRFTASSAAESADMGGSISWLSRPVKLHIQIPGEVRTNCRVYRYGTPILSTHRKKISINATKPGAYRVEVDLHIKGRHKPWIICNPIYVE